MRSFLYTLIAGTMILSTTSFASAGECALGGGFYDYPVNAVCYKWQKKVVEDFVYDYVPVQKKVCFKDAYGQECCHFVIDYKTVKTPIKKVVYIQVPCDPKTGEVIVEQQETIVTEGGATPAGSAAVPAEGGPAVATPAAPAEGGPAEGGPAVATPPATPEVPAQPPVDAPPATPDAPVNPATPANPPVDATINANNTTPAAVAAPVAAAETTDVNILGDAAPIAQ